MYSSKISFDKKFEIWTDIVKDGQLCRKGCTKAELTQFLGSRIVEKNCNKKNRLRKETDLISSNAISGQFFIVEDKIKDSSNKKIVKDEWYGPDSKCLFGCLSSHETLIERRRLKCVCEGNKKVRISNKLKI